MNITYQNTKELSKSDIIKLYSDAGWSAYTNDIEQTIRGIKKSLDVISAWDNDRLIGLIRVVGDGETIIYIQDILVLTEYKRNGIGQNLMNQIFDKYNQVRQIILSTDDEFISRSFYESLGMNSNLTSFILEK